MNNIYLYKKNKYHKKIFLLIGGGQIKDKLISVLKNLMISIGSTPHDKLPITRKHEFFKTANNYIDKFLYNINLAELLCENTSREKQQESYDNIKNFHDFIKSIQDKLYYINSHTLLIYLAAIDIFLALIKILLYITQLKLNEPIDSSRSSLCSDNIKTKLKELDNVLKQLVTDTSVRESSDNLYRRLLSFLVTEIGDQYGVNMFSPYRTINEPEFVEDIPSVTINTSTNTIKFEQPHIGYHLHIICKIYSNADKIINVIFDILRTFILEVFKLSDEEKTTYMSKINLAISLVNTTGLMSTSLPLFTDFDNGIEKYLDIVFYDKIVYIIESMQKTYFPGNINKVSSSAINDDEEIFERLPRLPGLPRAQSLQREPGAPGPPGPPGAPGSSGLSRAQSLQRVPGAPGSPRAHRPQRVPEPPEPSRSSRSSRPSEPSESSRAQRPQRVPEPSRSSRPSRISRISRILRPSQSTDDSTFSLEDIPNLFDNSRQIPIMYHSDIQPRVISEEYEQTIHKNVARLINEITDIKSVINEEKYASKISVSVLQELYKCYNTIIKLNNIHPIYTKLLVDLKLDYSALYEFLKSRDKLPDQDLYQDMIPIAIL